jgi:hypothetical protein
MQWSLTTAITVTLEPPPLPTCPFCQMFSVMFSVQYTHLNTYAYALFVESTVTIIVSYKQLNVPHINAGVENGHFELADTLGAW